MSEQTGSVQADPTEPLLAISFTGARTEVDPRRIATEMSVPNMVVLDDGLPTDELPGKAAATLFYEARAAGALLPPKGIVIDCYGSDDEQDAGILLIAYSIDAPRRGVTCGWRDVSNIARKHQDGPREERELVRAALEFMAAEINTALHGA